MAYTQARPSSDGHPSLVRRVPGETDLRVFTTEVIPAGRHRVRPGRVRLQVVRSEVPATPLCLALGW